LIKVASYRLAAGLSIVVPFVWELVEDGTQHAHTMHFEKGGVEVVRVDSIAHARLAHQQHRSAQCSADVGVADAANGAYRRIALGLHWSALHWIGLHWIGLDCIGD
jgi:hypothetical protein